MPMVAAIGRAIRLKLKGIAYGLGFFFQVLKETLFFVRRKQVGFKVLVMQILFTGFEALSVIAILSLALGAVIIIQGVSLLPQFGQGKLIYTILIIVITRELGPILTAFIIIARSGTAIAAELGNMVISHEIEAYISVGINPISYLVVPRFLGVTISMFILNLYFNIFGLIGSFLVAQLIKPIPFVEYFNNLLGSLRAVDITASLIKSVIFGIIISVVATYNGFKVQRSSTEIPQVVIKSVGQGVILCILANAVISVISYL
ncbi:MAG: ABC transporter permease [Spirochaetales bacterium]|nr:MAG: ABC transporter permease [Spirochaetales bacterium]